MIANRLNLKVQEKVSELRDVAKNVELRTKFYKTLFRGKGLDFDGYRVYSPDDDASMIDWKASVKANEILVRKYIEERDLNILFVVDVGDNMVFGSGEKLKCEYTAEFVLALGRLMMDSRDRVGVLLFSDEVKSFIYPSSGENHFADLIEVLSNPSNYGGVTNFDVAFDHLIGVLNNQNIPVVLFASDFLNLRERHEYKLGLVSGMFENMAFMIKDPLDRSLPNVSQEIAVEDPRTGEQMIINPKIARTSYEYYAMKQEKTVKGYLEDAGIDHVLFVTDSGFTVPLVEFLRARVKMKERR